MGPRFAPLCNGANARAFLQEVSSLPGRGPLRSWFPRAWVQALNSWQPSCVLNVISSGPPLRQVWVHRAQQRTQRLRCTHMSDPVGPWVGQPARSHCNPSHQTRGSGNKYSNPSLLPAPGHRQHHGQFPKPAGDLGWLGPGLPWGVPSVPIHSSWEDTGRSTCVPLGACCSWLATCPAGRPDQSSRQFPEFSIVGGALPFLLWDPRIPLPSSVLEGLTLGGLQAPRGGC